MRWYKNAVKKVETTDRKMKLYSLIMLVLLTIFGISIIRIANARNNKQITKYEESNAANKLTEKKATYERDIVLKKATELQIELSNLKGQVKEQNLKLDNLNTSYKQGFTELKKYKNEKNYIPNNVPTGTQSSYLSEYQYKPY